MKVQSKNLRKGPFKKCFAPRTIAVVTASQESSIGTWRVIVAVGVPAEGRGRKWEEDAGEDGLGVGGGRGSLKSRGKRRASAAALLSPISRRRGWSPPSRRIASPLSAADRRPPRREELKRRKTKEIREKRSGLLLFLIFFADYDATSAKPPIYILS
jgi:hypothetical protein